MNPPEFHQREIARDKAIERLLLTEPGRDRYIDDCVCRLRDATGFPFASFSVVSQNKQYFKSQSGGDQKHVHRRISFCGHTILQSDAEAPFVVEDATADPVFQDNPLVTGNSHIRTYVGAAIRNQQDLPLGTVCLLGNRRKPVDACVAAEVIKARDGIEEYLRSREAEAREVDFCCYDSARDNSLGGCVKRHIELACSEYESGELAAATANGDWGFIFLGIDPKDPVALLTSNSAELFRSQSDRALRKHFRREGDICLSIGRNEWFIGIARCRLEGTLHHLANACARVKAELREISPGSVNIRAGGLIDNIPANRDDTAQHITYLMRCSRDKYIRCLNNEIAIARA